MRMCIKLWPQGLPWYLPLSVLALQTTIPLLIRHTRRPTTDGSPQYHPASVTLLAELCKCLVAFGFIYRATKRQQPKATRLAALGMAGRKFTGAIWRLSTLLLPALLYFASNVTAMHALSHLRSYIFTAIMNSRIVFAALLSVLVLRKSINPEQWRAIVIIFCSATVLCLEDMKVDEEGGSLTWTEESFGMLIAVNTALVSAAGGVLVEKYLSSPSTSSTSTTTFSPLPPPGGAAALRDNGGDKRQQQASTAPSTLHHTHLHPTAAATSAIPPTLWEQQGVLALFSAAFADLYVLLFLPDAVKTHTVLEGWNVMTVVVILMQALHGILVAMTIQKCGIVFRLILGTISICLCICVESVVFLEPIVFREVLSIVMVIVGSNMYSNGTPPLLLPQPPAALREDSSVCSSDSSSSSCNGCGTVAPLLGLQKEGEAAAASSSSSMMMMARGNSRRRYSPTPA